MSAEPRDRLLRRAFRLEALTVGWNIVEGVVAVAAGLVASSVALVAFGIDSFIETASAVVVGWRFWDELRHRSPERAERAERLAGIVAGSLLLLLALYITADALRRLLGHGARSEESLVGIVLTAVSLVVMPLLGWAKLRTARALRSGALRADAYETIACAWLSLTTLVGLGLNAALGWWWADPAAALVLVPLIVREGLEGLRGEEEDEGEGEDGREDDGRNDDETGEGVDD
jgi:cation diffusion facilitator family transporter